MPDQTRNVILFTFRKIKNIENRLHVKPNGPVLYSTSMRT